MIWFLATITVILAVALSLPAGVGYSRRRVLEAAALLVIALPALRGVMEASGAEPSAAFAEAMAVSEHVSFGATLALIWAGGAVIALVRLVRRAAALAPMCRNAKPLSTGTAGNVSNALGLNLATVVRHFRQSVECATPMVLPTLPAKVLLPADWDEWKPRLQAAALRHEWHHVRHGDALCHFLMQLFASGLWFHPLAWRLAASWADECERCADRAAVGAADPTDYASDLLSLILPSSQPMTAMALGFFGPGKSRMHRRIEALLQSPAVASAKSHLWLGAATLSLLLLLALGCAWTGIRSATPDLRHEAELRLSADAFPAN